MDDFDFGDDIGNGSYETAKELKDKLDELINEYFSNGYSEELYVRAKALKADIDKIDLSYLQQANINMAFFDKVFEEHEKYQQILSAAKTLDDKYIDLLEKALLSEDKESLKKEIEELITEFKNSTQEVRKASRVNLEKLEVLLDRAGSDNPDNNEVTYDEGLNLSEKSDLDAFYKRIAMPFAKQYILKILELTAKKDFDKKGCLEIDGDKIIDVFNARLKAHAQLADMSLKEDTLDNSLIYDPLNGELVFKLKPVAFSEVTSSYTGRRYYSIYSKLTIKPIDFCLMVFDLIEKSINAKWLSICIYPLYEWHIKSSGDGWSQNENKLNEDKKTVFEDNEYQDHDKYAEYDKNRNIKLYDSVIVADGSSFKYKLVICKKQ